MDSFDDDAKPRRRKPATAFRIGLAGLIGIIILSGGAGYLGGVLGGKGGFNNTAATSKQTVVSEGQLVNGIAKDVGPSVVSVNVTSAAAAGDTQQSMLQRYFGQQQQGGGAGQTQQSAGTGIIIDSNGTIMTNRHVVPDANSKVSVTLSDGTELDDVKIIGQGGASSGLDVAFLKINDAKGHKLTAAKLGDSSKTQVGDRVVAIGNALGQFQNTVTSGIISGYGRSVQAGDSSGASSDTESLQDLFQTDAAINEGNSGGPLVNASGEVIGMNTAIAGNAQNIGFAIPVNDVSGLVKSVIQTGKFEQPYLGVRYLTLTDDVAKQLGLKATRGAYILAPSEANGQDTVISGGPADKAGLQARDIIQSVGNQDIDSSHSLSSLLAQHGVNDSVDLKVLRDGQTKTITVKLEAAPQAAATPAPAAAVDPTQQP